MGRKHTGDVSRIVRESIGSKFGKLTVLDFVEYAKTPRGANVPMVCCECECGGIKVVSVWDVRSGKTKTCGFDHPHYEDRSMPAFNNIFEHSYRNRALKNGIEFTITREQFKELTQSNCHYCGSEPSGKTYRNGTGNTRGLVKSGKHLSQYIYNGLDKVDSNKGYTLENVVPCCGICNHAKHTLSYLDFVQWLNRVVKWRISMPELFGEVDAVLDGEL